MEIPLILFIGAADNSGGAARASYRQVEALRSTEACQVKMLVNQKREFADHDIDVFPPDRIRYRKPTNVMHWVERKLGKESVMLPWQNKLINHPFVQNASVIHLQNIHGGFLNISSIPALSKVAPVFWTTHDLWPLTGHCYYPDSYDCFKWIAGCYKCPGLSDANFHPLYRDGTTDMWLRKKSAYSDADLTFIAQSSWCYDKLRASDLVASNGIEKVPHCVDVDRYKPIDVSAARMAFELPLDKILVVTAAPDFSSSRKGGKELLDVMSALKQSCIGEDVAWVIIGDAQNLAIDPSIEVHNLGYLSDERMLCLAYNTADIYVTTSSYETWGNTLMEAMACGKPSICFAGSGLDDMLDEGVTGFGVTLGDIEVFAKRIKQLVDDVDLRLRLGQSARTSVVQNYSYEVVGPMLLEAYRNARHRFDKKQ